MRKLNYTQKTWICGIIFGLIFWIWFIVHISYPCNVSIEKVSPEKVTLIFSDNLEHKRLIYGIFSDTALEVYNSHEYKLHKFDCTDFSKEVKKKLIEKGFDAYCVFGLLKGADYPLHTWIEVKINDYNFVWIESTNGEIIEDRNNYKLLSKTRNCI